MGPYVEIARCAWSVFRLRAEQAPDAGDLKAKTPAAFHELAARLRPMDGLVEFELSWISK